MIYHQERLDQVDSRLAYFVRVLGARLAMHGAHIMVVCGWRGEADQHLAFVEGRSKVDWPDGAHNRTIEGPDGEKFKASRAVDLAPYPYDAGKDKLRLYLIAGYAVALAEEMGIKLRIGADWSGDFKTTDQTLHDPFHYELKI